MFPEHACEEEASVISQLPAEMEDLVSVNATQEVCGFVSAQRDGG